MGLAAYGDLDLVGDFRAGAGQALLAGEHQAGQDQRLGLGA